MTDDWPDYRAHFPHGAMTAPPPGPLVARSPPVGAVLGHQSDGRTGGRRAPALRVVGRGPGAADFVEEEEAVNIDDPKMVPLMKLVIHDNHGAYSLTQPTGGRKKTSKSKRRMQQSSKRRNR